MLLCVENRIKFQEIALVRIVISINIPEYFNLVNGLVEVIFIVDDHFETDFFASEDISAFKGLSKNSIA